MTVQSGRFAVRVPQLALQYIGNRRTALSSTRVERVPALYNVFQSQYFSKVVLQYKLNTPALGRSYAQKAVSRPKAHTGRTTTAARKATTTSRTKAAPKAAPKAARKATKSKAVSRTKSKAKPKPRIKAKPKPAKKKRAKAKPKPKPKAKKPKKVLTEAEKTALTKKKLKVIALRAPHPTVSSAWQVFVAEKVKAAQGSGNGKLSAGAKEASAEYKQLTPEQREHYNHIANQNKAKNATAYRQWIESHSPIVIFEANRARRSLRNLGPKKRTLNTEPLHDDRQVKGYRGAFTLFYLQRVKTGDYKGMLAAEATKLAAGEWKSLSASEKKPFQDLATQDMRRYEQERKTVLNLDVRRTKVKA